jgi:anti-anti-sigma factor
MIQPPFRTRSWLVPETSGENVLDPQLEPAHFGWSLRRTGETLLVGVSGELDMLTCSEFQRRLLTLVRTTDAGQVVLDLSEVDFLGARGIDVIVSAWHEAHAHCRTLRVSRLSAGHARLLRLLGLDLLLVSQTWEESFERAFGDRHSQDSPARCPLPRGTYEAG